MEKKTNYIDTCISLLLVFFMMISSMLPVNGEDVDSDDNSIKDNVSIDLVYGADKQSDGTYVWNVPFVDNGYQAGHHFVFQIAYTTSQSVDADKIHITIPKHLIKNRNNQDSDTVEWSIPSDKDVEEATIKGQIPEDRSSCITEADQNGEGACDYLDSEQIDNDVYLAYREEENNYVIYNFRSVNHSLDGTFDISYSTAENAFKYKDMSNFQLQCNMNVDYSELDENGDPKTVTKQSISNSVNVVINTGAVVNTTFKQYPNEGRIRKWNDNWGDVKPSDAETDPITGEDLTYYYQIWDIRSNISANQPYTFKIDDTIAGTYTDDEGSHSDAGNDDNKRVKVLGYHFSGGAAGYHLENSIRNQTSTGDRWDSVLVAVPKDPYTDEVSWKIKNSETATVTPEDKIDNPTSRSASQNYTWSKPVFHEPGGNYNAYKRGDKWRYDLQNFNGYNGEQSTLDTYDGFSYRSWTIAYPYPYTKDTTADIYNSDEPWTGYGNKPVKYELTDEGVFLLNKDPSPSLNGSTENTIANGKLDPNAAIELTSEDFKIYQLSFSTSLKDAEYESRDKGEFQSKNASLSDKDIIVFEGKFDGSDWQTFGVYNLKTGSFTYQNSNYVKTASNGSIKFNDNVSMTAYKVSMANAHYFTQLDTVPYIALKNSTKVLNHIKNKNKIIILNNNHGVMYQLADNINYNVNDTEYVSFIQNSNNWKQVFEKYNSDSDYARAAQKSSKAEKSVVSTSNNVKRKYYTITWKLNAFEQIETDAIGTKEKIEQSSGIFYDLLPSGSTFDSKTVQVVLNDSNSANGILPSSEYSVNTISNYRNSGRTMVVIQINAPADSYTVTYDTRHAWNSIKDYGKNVYNPVAFETGNDSIAGGYADNAGNLRNKQYMDDLSRNTGTTTDSETGKKFIYADNSWDIAALTTAAAGLTKKVKAEDEYKYDSSTTVHLNGIYSYELRYMNNSTTQSKNVILFDSLENYTDPDGKVSEWKGTLQSVDVSQLTKNGVNPDIYISTYENLDLTTNNNVKDTSVWTKVDENTDLSTAKAVAIDASKSSNGSDYVLGKGESLSAYLYMKAPDNIDDQYVNGYPYAYNNVYAKNTFIRNDTSIETPGTLHYDYTSAKLVVTGNVRVHKINSETKQPVRGITFRLFGTSDYGNRVDVQKSSDNNGTITFENIEKGSYILQEYNSTDDYLLDATEHNVVIDKTGKTSIDGIDYSDNAIEIENKPRVHADVSFYKVDSMFTSMKLGGAKYRLSGRSDYGTDVLMTEESSSDKDNLGRVTFKNVEKGTYSLKEIEAPKDHSINTTEYTVYIDENGNYSIYKIAENDVYEQIKTEVTKYSHTQNISDDGTQNSSYGANWGNSNITGTDRSAGNAQAHVVKISGVKALHVKITWGGESSSYDWVSVWEGSHPDYTAYNNYSTGIAGANRLGGGSHTSASNTKEFDVDGDSVTFSFRSDSSGSGEGYGYYAVITGEQIVQTENILYHKGDLMEIDKDSSDYILKDEPLHYFTFQKLSSYDKSPIEGAEFKLTGISNNGTTVNATAKSDNIGFVRFEGLESGKYILQETKAPDGFEINDGKYIVDIDEVGKSTISGGLSLENNVYTMYDTKTADKKFTVTKVWDDGYTGHKPEALTITITTDVPQQSQRTFTVVYDANGGSFGNE